MLNNKKTIWLNEATGEDVYAEFVGRFRQSLKGEVVLRIACEGHFAVEVNDKLVYFGASADYPWYKMYHITDITADCGCVDAENEIKIFVWYQGIDSQTVIKDVPGVFFEVVQDNEILLQSDENIMSRVCNKYRNGYCKTITTQLGLSFYYDNTKTENLSYSPSRVMRVIEELHLRKSGYLQMGDRVLTSVIENDEGYLIDMQAESVGFLELHFDTETEQEIIIAYSEHLKDDKVPRYIGNRDFSVEFKACRGENQYLNPFRRLAGRYLQIYCDKPLQIHYVGLRSVNVCIEEIKHHFSEPLLQQIYDVSVNTLHKCMHEHYEDCPWREQAMYTLDSRNQMLCGYYAFAGHEYQRENLLFIAKGQRKDGLLSLCFPAGIDIPIPFFSLVYFLQVSEYVQHTKDVSVLSEVQPVLRKILKAFDNKKDENCLIANFPYPYWNFYEWSKASNNEHEILRKAEDKTSKQYDLILNCMYVIACDIYNSLFHEDIQNKEMISIIHNTFYNENKGLYKLSTNGEAYSQLGNSFAILAGLGNESIADLIVNDKSLIPVTLSMNTFYYDALLSVNSKFREFVVEDIKSKYGKMLAQGATTFWETEKGWQDFDGAGSLCHGWSAIPVFYLSILSDKRFE